MMMKKLTLILCAPILFIISCSNSNSDNASIELKSLSISNYSTDDRTLNNTLDSGEANFSITCPDVFGKGNPWVTTQIIGVAKRTIDIPSGYKCDLTLSQYKPVPSSKEYYYIPDQGSTELPLILHLDENGTDTNLLSVHKFSSSLDVNKFLWFAATANQFKIDLNYGISPNAAQGGASQLLIQAVTVTIDPSVNAPKTDGNPAQRSSFVDTYNKVTNYQLFFGPVTSPDGGTIGCKIVPKKVILSYDYLQINNAYKNAAITCPAFNGSKGNWDLYQNEAQVIIWQNSLPVTVDLYGYLYLEVPKTSDW